MTGAHDAVAQLTHGDHGSAALAAAVGPLDGGEGDTGAGLGDSLEELGLVGRGVGFTSFDVGRFGVVTSVEGKILNGHPFVGLHKVKQFLPDFLLATNAHNFGAFVNFSLSSGFGRH